MARKKTSATTEVTDDTTEETVTTASEETAETEETTEETTSESAGDTTDTEDTSDTTSKGWIYIGPSIAGGKLSQNTILRGTRTEVMAYVESRAPGYSLSLLVVEINSLAAARQSIRAKDGAIWQAYQKVLKQMRLTRNK